MSQTPEQRKHTDDLAKGLMGELDDELPEFRIWSLEEKKMYEGQSLLHEGNEATVYLAVYSSKKWKIIKEEIDVTDTDSLTLPEKRTVLFSSDNALLLISTEYFEKNMRKVVYKGDIVSINGGLPIVVQYRNNVFNLDECDIAKDKESGIEYFTNIEVLGNVYENPELAPIEL